MTVAILVVCAIVAGGIIVLAAQAAKRNQQIEYQLEHIATLSNHMASLEDIMRVLARATLESDPVSRLRAGEAYVVGVWGEAGRVIPVRVAMNFPEATEVKLGNTPEELEGASWRPYAPIVPWRLPSGRFPKFVHIASKTADGSVSTLKVKAPDYEEALGVNYHFGPIPDYDPRVDSEGLLMLFDEGDEYWVSYANDAKIVRAGNAFYPVSWSSRGGARGGFVWTDSSRWLIDTPEDPDSVLALMTYGRWSTACEFFVGPMDVSFSLKGDALDLKGATVHFWVMIGGKARFHYVETPLSLTPGQWTTFEVPLRGDGKGWARSWSRDGEDIKFDLGLGVDSIGISIRGFPVGEMPTGRLAIDEVRLKPLEGFQCRRP